ncbi:MAG TPA: amino acid adenylation domain-containing protein [Candidatus Cybelea sp.]|nr:amino acid adenylation domain-containing protein [Candidatus Cybelea sp.]
MSDWNPTLEGVAIVGMAGRFPGARSVAEFWTNQLEGREVISQFRPEDLEVPRAAELSQDPSYVRARSVVADADLFDAEFFGMHPREAELTDPQHRLFLESCWEAVEDAGYDPGTYPGAIGVYAGASPETYFFSRLCSQTGFLEKFTGGYQVDHYAEMVGNSRDFLATRVSYKLNLRGPSFTIQAGCSTSLVAVTQACQALLTYDCDMALAGGSSITFPQKRGAYYQDGAMISPDGHCRTFDADAQGTVFGSGVAVVLLKRLDEAVRDGDQVYAVIRGFATNNDGAGKVGFTAPSVEGQRRVIAMAQAAAGISPDTIGYIEAHGTATPLGDPIELAALTQAFRAHTRRKEFCVVGTAKTNIGHLDVAAGVTGLIHATHIVRQGVFPPTLHFRKPNPKFDLENSPFYVTSRRSEWKSVEPPRRAGVSSFGVGGTNAHVVLEQAPDRPARTAVRPAELLVLSARTETALKHATTRLADHLAAHPEENLEDLAWTLQTGRRRFAYRRAVAARNTSEAVAALAKGTKASLQDKTTPELCFLFPGQGSQHTHMGREIYASEPVFRDAVDRCAEILRPALGVDLRNLLYPGDADSGEIARRVTDTVIAQPAIFTVEYALAQLWMSWDIRPQAMLGHSIGEFVAACLAGVFSLEDALHLVAARGQMMQALPAGGMLSVRLGEEELRSRLNGHLSLAAVNSPSLCVVAGSVEALEDFQQQLEKQGIPSRRLATSHAFHSAMMDPIMEPFRARVAEVRRNQPKLPYVSGVTGEWILAEEATDPAYWARHFRQPVRFSAGVEVLLGNPATALLEVGPGTVLSTLARQHPEAAADRVIVSSLSDGYSGEGDAARLMYALGALWTAGVEPNWRALYHGTQPERVSLPTYPFERKRYWLEAPHAVAPPSEVSQQDPVRADARPTEATSQVKTPAEPTRLDRRARIARAVGEIFEDLSGSDLRGADPAATFLEMGFDSLFLTQVAQAVERKFGVKVTFRQLLGEQSSIGSLAEFLDKKLPPEALAEPAAAPAEIPLAPAEVPAREGIRPPESPVERMMREQIKAMNELFARQLEALGGAASAAFPSSAARPVQGISPLPSAPDKPAKELEGYTPFKPLKAARSTDLTPGQREYLRSLVERYTKRTAGSKARTQQDRQVLADPRVASGFRSEWKEMVYPIVTVRSAGSHLWDVDGNEYVDILNGFGPIMLGHRPEFVRRAITKQLEEGFEIGPQTVLAGEVAKLICELTGNERVTFCNTGSEAVVAAMRVARTVTGRDKIVFFAGDYHGMFDEVLVKGSKKGGQPHAIPAAPGIPREKAANVVVLEYGSEEALEWIRANATELAAVLVEPVQSRHPNLQPVEFLKEIRRITEQSATCLVFDEVVTGFRVHPGGCQALFDIRADLVTYGKVLAGGMPIGVLAGKARYMDALDGGMWQFGDDSYPSAGVTFFAGTFVRHPLTLAAAKAVLEHLKQQGPELQGQLARRTATLVENLNEILARHNVPARLESFSSIFYFSFPADFRFGSLFYYHLREKGIHILEGFPCFLTTAHSERDLERIIRAFEETAAEMRAGGVLADAESKAPAPPRLASANPTFVAEAPMTEPQREIFLAASVGDDASCSFNESFSLYLRGRLDAEALGQAIDAVVNGHDALRSTVDPDGTKLRFRGELKIELPVIDLAPLERRARETELRRLIEEDAGRQFDLTTGPLVRAQLVRLEPNEHVLLFTSHHIVCDGWSTNVLLDELAAFYTAKVRGRAAERPVAPSFAEYAQKQSEAREGRADREVESYWLEQFKDLPAALELPLDRPRKAVRTYPGATFRAHMDRESYLRIKQMGSKHGSTLFVVLLAAFQTLLYRLSNQLDIVVGVPTAGQSLVGEDKLVGHCVNFLPLRTRFRPDLGFAELLEQVKRTLLDAYDHRSYTYGTLVRRLAMRRDPGRLPLMEVQFNLERVGGRLPFEGLETTVDPNPKRAVNFDIFFNVVESDAGLTIDCDYNTDLFDRTTIARWLTHYQTLLEAAARDVRLSANELPLMTPAEMDSLISAWNPNWTEYPVNSTIHALFERQASLAPDAVALALGDQRLTYGELNERANQLARVLRAKGVRPDSLVAVSFERSIEMMVALLAVLKAGGAYVPIDSSYPRERLTMMFEDSAPALVLTEERLLRNLPEIKPEIVCVDRDWPAIAREGTANLEPAAKPENLAYVIYTSGSTGKPKGVMITHANFVRLLGATKPWLDFSDRDVWSLFHTYSFDVSVWEMWGCLLTGGRLVIVPYWLSRSPAELHALLKREQVTVLCQTPVAFYQLIEADQTSPAPLGDLRYVMLAGEALHFRNLEPWLRLHGDQAPQIINMYGPTEATVYSTYRRLEAHDIEHETRSLIGVPLRDSNIYILDAKQKPVPPGVPGELHIAGAGVARGYLDRPELTKERFLPDPFAQRPGSRMYKSGDWARFLPSGDLEFLGRLDDQVKIHGFRVELGEIEAAIAQHQDIRQVSVLARTDGETGSKLVAYFVARPGSRVSGTALREYLATKIPAHMIPYAYLELEALPLSPSGKVDRTQLPAPSAVSAATTREYVAPRTREEKILADILAEVLRLERVGVTDSLFELGADSLHVFQITSRAAKAGLNIGPKLLLEQRTVAGVIAELENSGAPAPAASAAIKPVARDKYRLIREVRTAQTKG